MTYKTLDQTGQSNPHNLTLPLNEEECTGGGNCHPTDDNEGG